MEKNINISSLFSVKDKVIFLTGGGGIGEYLIEAYLENGGIVITTNRTQKKCDALIEKMKSRGYNEIYGVAMDQTDSVQMEKTVDYILEKFGRIDVLLIAVGYSSDCAAEDFSEDEIQKMIDINYVSAARLSQIVAKKAMIP